MKTLRCFTSTASALDYIFLGGTGSTRRSLSTFLDGRFVANAQPQNAFQQKLVRLHDANIQAREVRVVDENNTLKPPAPLLEVLKSFDRKLYTLVQVSPTEEGKIPVCKIFEKKALREAERAKAKAKKDPATLVKQLELNWAISPNDLGHRLNKMVEFLEQGKRVEVILAGKRKGRKATEEEAVNVLKSVRARVTKTEGAREWKDMEGKVSEQVTLFFEGKLKT
ncbi:hypothetical protein MMC16_002645 [Acarospora aff. strigata]|nr:hypothetical protein [Acarospora aff. strigata]